MCRVFGFFNSPAPAPRSSEHAVQSVNVYHHIPVGTVGGSIVVVHFLVIDIDGFCLNLLRYYQKDIREVGYRLNISLISLFSVYQIDR